MDKNVFTNHEKTGRKGAFIAFEGIDGSGKTTQIAMLKERLKKEGYDCYTTMEPTQSPIGSLIRQILVGRMKADNKVIAALFAADRLDHLLNEIDGIAAKLSEGVHVITDRYYFSSYAYHSVDMPMDLVIRMNESSSDIARPAVTVFVDVDPDIALDRIERNRQHKELFEEKSRLVQVRENYYEAFRRLNDCETVVIVDGNREADVIAEDIWQQVMPFLSEKH